MITVAAALTQHFSKRGHIWDLQILAKSLANIIVEQDAFIEYCFEDNSILTINIQTSVVSVKVVLGVDLASRGDYSPKPKTSEVVAKFINICGLTNFKLDQIKSVHKAVVTQLWQEGALEFDFPDGSILTVKGKEINHYSARF